MLQVNMTVVHLAIDSHSKKQPYKARNCEKWTLNNGKEQHETVLLCIVHRTMLSSVKLENNFHTVEQRQRPFIGSMSVEVNADGEFTTIKYLHARLQIRQTLQKNKN